MAQGKQTPRQKMINLMYLVFIAMMALNIDAEIIRSYYESTESLKETRGLTELRNTDIFEKTLEEKAAAVPDTYAKPWDQYKVLKVKIDDLVTHVDGIKTKLKKESDFNEKDPETGEKLDVSENFASLNNNEATMAYFFVDGDENSQSNLAKELKTKMNDVRNYISQTFGNTPQMKSLVDRANKALLTDYPGGKAENGKTWLQNKFYNQPLIAAVSNLEIIQNDARNVQSDALALMLQEKVDASIKFNMYDAIVKAPTDIVQGTNATAEVYLASYSNSNKINIKGVSRQENGKGFIPLNTSSVGEKTFNGSIDVLMADGRTENVPYTHTYNVIRGQTEVDYETGATVTADKMNVLYRGLDNPISGAVLGVDNSRLSLSAAGASVRGTGPGKWIVRPGGGNTVNLTISGSGPRGTTTESFTFRIKNVPPAQGMIRGKNALSMPVSSVPNQILDAEIPDFDFPVNFTVTGFKARVPGRASTYVSGNSLRDLSSLVSNLRSGDGVYIFDIEATATGLGGQKLKTISPVLITIL